MENQTVTPNQPVQQPAPQQTAPAGQLKTNRGLLKFILLNIIILGIYSLVIFSGISSDINVIASRYDGKKTMHFCLLFFLVGPITLGIADIVWFHRISNRIGNELQAPPDRLQFQRFRLLAVECSWCCNNCRTVYLSP